MLEFSFLAMQVPVVGLTPLKSLEQISPCLLFLGMQLLELEEYQLFLFHLELGTDMSISF